MPSLIEVEQRRASLWAAGLRPVPVYNAAVGDAKSGKAPRGAEWQLKARQNPPAGAVHPAEDVTTNTGILCDGLRAIDIDVDDQVTALRVAGVVKRMLGDAPMRFRNGSGRVLLVYRAAEAEPPKRVLAGDAGKVEMLGHGQQFVAYGTHWTGAELQWTVRPEAIGRANLPVVTEEQITEFLREAAAIIGAAPEGAGAGGAAGERRTSERGIAAEDLLRVAADMDAIPNVGPADWERWNRAGMALWGATGGSQFGRDLWHGWSARNPAYDPDATDERWTHFAQSPPKSIGAGTLIHMARQALAGAAFVAAAEGDTPAARRPTGILLLTPGECAAAPSRGYLIKGLLAPGDVGCLFGPPGAGKSVLAPHLAWAVAQGATAFGRKTRPGTVFYVAAEDEAGGCASVSTHCASGAATRRASAWSSARATCLIRPRQRS